MHGSSPAYPQLVDNNWGKQDGGVGMAD